MKTDDLYRNYLPIIFKDTHERHLSLKDTDPEQNKFANKLMSIDKSIKPTDRKSFLSNKESLFYAREEVLSNFKSRLFPIKKLELKIEEKLEPELETEPIHKCRNFHENRVKNF